MTEVDPITLEGFEEHLVEGGSRGALLLTTATEFQLAVVCTFGALYEVSGTSVYSTDDKNKKTSANAHRCIKFFEKAFQSKEIFSSQVLSEEGDNCTHDICGTIRRNIEEGTIIDNWVKLWTPLLGNTFFTAQETQHFNTLNISS